MNFARLRLAARALRALAGMLQTPRLPRRRRGAELAAGEARLALLEQRADSLARVLAPHRGGLREGLGARGRARVPAGSPIERALQQSHGLRRARGDRLGPATR